MNPLRLSFFQKLSGIFSDNEVSPGECFLALDIGTSSIKSAVFKVEQCPDSNNYKSIIIGAGRALYSGNRNNRSNFDKIIQASEEAKKEAENMAGVKASALIVSFAGQIIKGYADFETFQREEPEKPIDLSEIKYIVQKLEWKIFGKIRKHEQEEYGVPEMQINLLHGRILGVKIDGYKVSDPLGFKGSEISLNILNTFCSRLNLKFLKKLEKQLGFENVIFACQPFAIFSAVANKFFKTGYFSDISALHIDFGGRSTDISLLQHGFFEGPKTISIGGESFTRRLNSKFSLSQDEAEELKIRYVKGNLSPTAKRKITTLFDSDLKVLLRGIETVLSDFLILGNFPLQIIFSGGAGALSGIKKYIEENDWQEKLKVPFLPLAKIISLADMNDVKDKTGLLKDSSYVAIAALALQGIEFYKRQPAVDSILQKIIRMMQT